MPNNRYARMGLVIGAVVAFAGCGAREQSVPSANTPAVKEFGVLGPQLRVGAATDSWTTFAHDYERSGYNSSVTYTPSSVSKLQLRWKENAGGWVFASPVAYAGNLIVVTWGGPVRPGYSSVYDFSTSNGSLLWKYDMGSGSEGQMTPTIDPDAGLVIVAGEHKLASEKYSDVFALHLLDGSVAWHQQLQGLLRATPVVTGGSVYLGRAGGDPSGSNPHCLQGGITALNESTGKVEWNWYVDDTPDEGGSVWGAIAYDGTHLIFGTGNTCQEPVPTANGAVALTLGGKLVWSMVAVKDSYYDSDTGSGVTLAGGLAHFINKNGEFYALDQQTGKLAWSTDLNPYASPNDANGGFTTATTDGTTIVEGSGTYKDTGRQIGGEFCKVNSNKPGEIFKGYHSELQGMNMGGKVLWAATMVNRLVGYVALTKGIGFVPMGQQFVALNLKNGKTLWSYAAPAYIEASMIVVPSGVYGADDSGNVYAFAVSSKKLTQH